MSKLLEPPRKKRSAGTDSSSHPQTSISRSTPIRESSPIDNVSPPSVSTIRSSSSTSSSLIGDSIIKKQGKQLDEVENRVSILQISRVNLEDSSSDFEERPTNVIKLKQFHNKGQNWKFIKPTNQNSLYFKIILSRNQDIESLALGWCKDYTDNADNAIVELQQLFVDLTGVRKFSLSDILSKNNNELEKAVEVLESTILKTDLHKYYLCNSTHQYAVACLEEICKFLRLVWIISSDQMFLYDSIMSFRVLKLINFMSVSAVKPIHHTGIFLAIKMLTFTSELNKNISKAPLDKNDMEEYLRLLLKKEECFLVMLFNYCCTNMLSPTRAKIQCLDESLYWFKRIPHLVFKEKYLNLLLALIEDTKNAKIRQKALAISKDLVASTKFSEYITPVLNKLLQTIEERMWDVDYDVSINAIEFFSLLSENYPQYLTSKLEASIVRLIFQKNYPLARAAGQFTIKKFRKDADGGDLAVISNLIKILSVPMYADCIALLVESIIDFAHELQNYDLIYVMLMEEENTEEEDIILCSLLSQSVIQIVTGSSPIVREKCRKEKPQVLVNQKIAYFFITRLYQLMNKFSNNVICIKKFCEILLVLNYEETQLTHYNKYLDQLMSLQKSLFINIENEDVMDSLSKLYSTWMAEYSLFKLEAAKAFEIVLEETVKVYKINLEEYSEERSELLTSNLETDLLRLEVLFRYNDLRRVIDWSTLFVSWDLNDEYFTNQSVERNMKCCYWFLLWEARSLNDVPADSLQQNVDQLELKCTSFITQCISIMSKNQEKATLLQTAFDVILDLQLQLLLELSGKFSNTEQFKQLFLKVTTIQAQNVLVDYVLTRAFTATERETLKMRRSNVAKLMNAMIEDIIPHEKHIVRIFKFYAEYYDSYGDIFDSTLDIFQKLGGDVVVCSVTVLSMKYSFIEYLSLKENFDSSSPDVERINVLGQHFLRYMIKRKMAEDSILAVLKQAVMYSSTASYHRHFLHFFTSFIPALKTSQHKQLLNYIMESMPAGGEDVPETFVNFVKKLNYKRGKESSSSSLMSI